MIWQHNAAASATRIVLHAAGNVADQYEVVGARLFLHIVVLGKPLPFSNRSSPLRKPETIPKCGSVAVFLRDRRKIQNGKRYIFEQVSPPCQFINYKNAASKNIQQLVSALYRNKRFI